MIDEIKIRFVANGWVVQAGCQQFVFGTPTDLSTAVGEWAIDPVAKEKDMRENARNIKWTMGGPGRPCDVATAPPPTTPYPADSPLTGIGGAVNPAR